MGKKHLNATVVTLRLKGLDGREDKKDILVLIITLKALKLVFDRQRRKGTKLCQGWESGLHCRGPGENVNTGCQPPLHQRPGKVGVGVGGNRGVPHGKKKSKNSASHQLLINNRMSFSSRCPSSRK